MALPLAGAKILAADLAAIFPQGVGAWTSFTPTLTQGASTPAKTVDYARYTKVGRLYVVQVSVTVTGTGTASNPVLIGLPADTVNTRVVGSAILFDASAGVFFNGVAYRTGAATVQILGNNAGGGQGFAGGFSAALANGDVVSYVAMYEGVS